MSGLGLILSSYFDLEFYDMFIDFCLPFALQYI